MKPNTLYQRRRRARMYAAGLTSEGNPSRSAPPTISPTPAGLDQPTRIELAWAKERAGMDIVVRDHNWLERESIEARKEFK